MEKRDTSQTFKSTIKISLPSKNTQFKKLFRNANMQNLLISTLKQTAKQGYSITHLNNRTLIRVLNFYFMWIRKKYHFYFTFREEDLYSYSVYLVGCDLGRLES